jgi:CheY-like chemotaxis protein
MSDPEVSKRILIVDDEHIIADTLATIFSNAGYEAKAAYTAEQALALIEQWSPDLALIDVFLPGMNGVDLALRLKAELPGCRLTLISGQATTMDLVEQARQEGHIMPVIPKPIHPEELLRLLATTQAN